MSDSPQTPSHSSSTKLDPEAPLIEQMGGVKGLVTSSLPVLAFVPVNAIWGLFPAIWSAVAVAVAIVLWAVVRKERLQPAVSGLFAVAVCVVIAWRTGGAKGYFLYGIVTQAIYAFAFALSALVRWPLVGVIWNLLAGHGRPWREDRSIRRRYSIATWTWAAIFGVRFVLQSYLYSNDDVGWLGVARIVMGWPLAIAGFAVTLYALEKAGHRRIADT